MAASDPSPYVATPTGTLQGVAAYSWDGSAWQPSAGAGPDVATPTGVLRGVAPFSWSGSAWTPAGRSQPGVATPSGVLDGVAVYTWSGSAWTPTGGTATPSTSTGALRGVAAFNWDGSAWQPAAQARPSVPTPYGVLDGVAMFNWTGSAWAAVGAPTLDITFFGPTLDPSLTFTRGSTATYFDVTGTMQTVSGNTPRFDYDPVTHAARGLLIEEARQNIAVASGDLTTGWTWTLVTAVVGPDTSPNGTQQMTRIVETAASGAHYLLQAATVVASTAYTFSVYAKASQVRYLQTAYDDNTGTNGVFATFDLQSGVVSQAIAARGTATVGAATIQAVGNGIYRCTVSGTTGAFTTGRALIFTSNSGTPGWAPSYAGSTANGLSVWGAQLEQGAFPTSYIPTTAAAVTRSADSCTCVSAGIFGGTTGRTMSVDGLAVQNPAPATNTQWLRLDDGTSNNTMIMNTPASSANVRYSVTVGGVSQFSQGDVTTGVRPTLFKSALASGTVAHAAMNGVVDGGGGLPNPAMLGPLTTMYLGVGGIVPINGYIRRARYWPRMLSNAELQSVTT